MARVNIIFHSVSGHTYRLAEALGAGVVQVEEIEIAIARKHARALGELTRAWADRPK